MSLRNNSRLEQSHQALVHKITENARNAGSYLDGAFPDFQREVCDDLAKIKQASANIIMQLGF